MELRICEHYLPNAIYTKCGILFNSPCPYASEDGRWDGCNKYGEVLNDVRTN